MKLKLAAALIAIVGLVPYVHAATPGGCAFHLSRGVSVEAAGNEIKIETPQGGSLAVKANPQGGMVEITEPQLLAKAYSEEKLIIAKQGTTITVVGNKDGQLRELNQIDLSNFLDTSAIYGGVPAKIVSAGEKFDVIGYTNESESDRRSHYIQFQVIVRTNQALHLLSVYSDYNVGWNEYKPIRDVKHSGIQFDSAVDRVSAPWQLTSEGRFGPITRTVVTVDTKDGQEHIIYRAPMQTVREGWSPDPSRLVEIKK